jgi:hypothetical protein
VIRIAITLSLAVVLTTVGATLAADRVSAPSQTPFAPATSASPHTAPSHRSRPAAPKAKKRSPRLSRKAIAAAQPGCDRYVAAVRPHLYGAGLDDLRDQIRAFRSARRDLSRDLRTATTRSRDRRTARPLVKSLSDNGLLSRALGQLRKDRVEAAFATLSRWDKQTKREERIARRIGLRRCMDATRRS